MKDCDPSDYLTAEQHENLCKKSYNSIMNWAHQVAEDSVKDREDLHKKVDDLKDLIPKFQWWFIALLVTVIITSIVGPKFFSSNGQDAKFRELAGYIAAVTGQVQEQGKLIQEGNDISKVNQRELLDLKKEVKKK